MKIHYVMWSLNGGGAEFSTSHFIPKLLNLGCNFEITALTRGDFRAEPVIRKLDVPWSLLCEERKYVFSRLPNLFKYLQKTRPNLLWASLPGATMVAAILGRILSIPIVSWQHNAYLSKKNYFFYKIISSWIGHWVADSNAASRFLHDTFSIGEDKISVLPLFVANPANHQHSHHNSRKIRVGTIGKLHKQKGYDFLLQTAKYLRKIYPGAADKITFHIAGNGPEKDDLELQKQSLGLNNVHFYGFVKDIPSFLKKMDVYFQPSRWEGLCIAVLEGMVAGLPVVTSNTGGLKENVANWENGFSIESGDIPSYAEALKWFSINPDKRTEMGKKAREFALEHYSQTSFDRKLHAVYTKIQELAIER